MVKSLVCLKEAVGGNRDIKGDFAKDLEESRECDRDEASVIGNTYVLMSRMLVEIRTLKALLVRVQKEMRDLLLETKMILVL